MSKTLDIRPFLKRVDDLTDDEIRTIIRDETGVLFNTVVDFEAALKGIPFLPPDPGPEPEVDSTPDSAYYSISFSLTDLREVEAVRDLLRSLKSLVDYEYISGPSYTQRIKPLREVPDFSRKVAWSVEGYKARAAAIQTIEANKALYRRERDEYDSIAKRREEIVTRLSRCIDRVSTDDNNLERLAQEYERYKVLAQGDEAIAYRFLRDSRGNWEWALEIFFGRLAPEVQQRIRDLDAADMDSASAPPGD